MRKIVFSRSPLDFQWRNSEQAQGDVAEVAAALKREPGGDIGLSGSISIIRQLLAAGLLDELQLLVHPIAVRKGMRLFDEGVVDPAEAAEVGDVQHGGAELGVRAGHGSTDGGYEEAVASLGE